MFLLENSVIFYAQRTPAFLIENSRLPLNVKRLSRPLNKTIFTPKYKQVLNLYTNGNQEEPGIKLPKQCHLVNIFLPFIS